jgi:WhiB family transcriptional regulator, redox-sensing transcriptional regulator
MAGRSWRLDARCAEVDAELFFPEPGEPAAPAKRICAGCPVRVECLDYALAAREAHGVFGGLSAQERLRLLRKPRVAVVAEGGQSDVA